MNYPFCHVDFRLALRLTFASNIRDMPTEGGIRNYLGPPVPMLLLLLLMTHKSHLLRIGSEGLSFSSSQCTLFTFDNR